jgi:hypothetical protein
MMMSKGIKMTPNWTQRDKARELYRTLGSIKRAARQMKCSKAEIKKLLGQDWLNSIRNAQLTERNNRRGAVRQQTAFIKTTPRATPKAQQGRSHYQNESSGTIHTNVRTDQKPQNKERVFSTNKGAFEVMDAAAWGRVLIPVEDPRFRTVTSEDVKGIKLIDDFPRIPPELWTRWIDLCFHLSIEGAPSRYSSNRELEVQVLLCRKREDLTQWRILVPMQEVSGASVSAEVKDCIDIATGEKFDYFPPQGWLHVGSSHSHNTMDAFFSSTDDGSELSVPGLHIVVGRINKKANTYTQKSSIVLRKLRKHVDFHDVVDATPIEDVTFHEDVLAYVSVASWQSMFPTMSWGGPAYPKDDTPETTRITSTALQDSEDSTDDAARWRRFWKAVDNNERDDAITEFNQLHDTVEAKNVPSAAELLDDDTDDASDGTNTTNDMGSDSEPSQIQPGS